MFPVAERSRSDWKRAVSSAQTNNIMKVKYSKEVDVLYIQLNESAVAESDESKPGVIIDYNEAGVIVGIEILKASAQIAQPEMVDLELAA